LATAIRINVFPSFCDEPARDDDPGIGVGEARFETEITLPRRSRRFQFGLGPRPLGRIQTCPGRGKTLGQRKQLGQRREGAGADHVDLPLRHGLQLRSDDLDPRRDTQQSMLRCEENRP
jgi:hypothetical protein